GHPHAREQLDALDLHARDRVRQQLAHSALTLHAHGERSARVELAGGARRRDELLDRDLQREGDLVQDAERRVRVARLEVGPRGAWHARELRDLLLRQTARLPQLLDVLGEAQGELVVHAGRAYANRRVAGREAPRQWRAASGCVL